MRKRENKHIFAGDDDEMCTDFMQYNGEDSYVQKTRRMVQEKTKHVKQKKLRFLSRFLNLLTTTLKHVAASSGEVFFF
jgi:hypothetical protein